MTLTSVSMWLQHYMKFWTINTDDSNKHHSFLPKLPSGLFNKIINQGENSWEKFKGWRKEFGLEDFLLLLKLLKECPFQRHEHSITLQAQTQIYRHPLPIQTRGSCKPVTGITGKATKPSEKIWTGETCEGSTSFTFWAFKTNNWDHSSAVLMHPFLPTRNTHRTHSQ